MQFIFAPDQISFTLDLPVKHWPGETFSYSNPISDLLSMILVRRTGMNLLDFANKSLFKPLGIQSPIWKMNSQGNNLGHGGLHLSTRDMAKIGFLYLNSGYWDEKQIVSKQWIEESTKAHVKAGSRYSYGYQWWIKPVSKCPSFRAWGKNGQFITVVPALDLVVAVTSETGLPGYSSENYSPLFDIIGDAVIDRSCGRQVMDEKIYCGQKNLPGDIKDFLDSFSTAVESKNIDNILDHYSDNFLHSGRTKGPTAKFLRITTQAISEFKFIIEQCRIKENRAKIWGEIASNMGPLTLAITDLKKENGSWKWYGNQSKK